MSSIQSIKNIGEAMEKHFKNAGFSNAEEIKESGLEDSYTRLLKSGMKPHFMAFLALAAGLENRNFKDHSNTEKMRLKIIHDRIKEENRHDEKNIEAVFNQFGIGF